MGKSTVVKSGEMLQIETGFCRITISSSLRLADGTFADVVQVRASKCVGTTLTTESVGGDPTHLMIHAAPPKRTEQNDVEV